MLVVVFTTQRRRGVKASLSLCSQHTRERGVITQLAVVHNTLGMHLVVAHSTTTDGCECKLVDAFTVRERAVRMMCVNARVGLLSHPPRWSRPAQVGVAARGDGAALLLLPASVHLRTQAGQVVLEVLL